MSGPRDTTGPSLSGLLDSRIERPLDFWAPTIVEAAQAAQRKALTDAGDALFELRQVERATQAATRALVAHALTSGMTWQEIGAALGTTRQATHERYGSLPSPSTRLPGRGRRLNSSSAASAPNEQLQRP